MQVSLCNSETIDWDDQDEHLIEGQKNMFNKNTEWKQKVNPLLILKASRQRVILLVGRELRPRQTSLTRDRN